MRVLDVDHSTALSYLKAATPPQNFMTIHAQLLMLIRGRPDRQTHRRRQRHDVLAGRNERIVICLYGDAGGPARMLRDRRDRLTHRADSV